MVGLGVSMSAEELGVAALYVAAIHRDLICEKNGNHEDGTREASGLQIPADQLPEVLRVDGATLLRGARMILDVLETHPALEDDLRGGQHT